MINPWPMSIRFRVMALSLLPMTLLALILGSYFTYTRLAETRTNLLDRGSAMTRLIASAAEFGVLSGNTELLRSLSSGPIRDDEVADVLFYDKDFRLLYRSSRFEIQIQRDQQAPRLEKGTWRFVQPIEPARIPFQDNPELLPISRQPETLGWVAVVISAQPTIQRERDILMRGVGLTLICLMITLFLANRFGRRITHPILGLTRLIERLQRGELDARADVSHTGELRTLASGINRLAARVQESNQQFEYRVESSTRRLTQTLRHLERRNRELQLERQRADEANHAKDEFLARMSHELRTPLTSVIGFTELLTHTRIDKQQRQYLQIITRTSALLLTIIDDILDYSRLESEAIEIEAIPFDLEQSLFDVIEAQSPAAGRKQLELIADLPTHMPLRVLGDPTRLCQVLNNLVGNAIKFTEHGEVALIVEVLRAPELEPRLLIRVRDTGIGIPAERVGQLFSAFTQGDVSISRRFGGSGLGLVIAHRLTELMGGSITLDSVEKSGTEVRVELPLKLPAESPKPVCVETSWRHEIVLYEPCTSSRTALLRLLRPLAADIRLIRRLEEICTLAPTKRPRMLIAAVSPQDCSPRSVQALCDRVRAQSNAPLVLMVPGRTPMRLQGDDLNLVAKPPRPGELYDLLGLPFATNASKPQPVSTNQLPYPLEILIAEDNDFNRLLIRRLLEDLGARVDEARSGQEVLNHLIDKRPDLILMDVHMPEMDGIQATHRVREQDKELPIIALTANVVPHEHRALVAAGINDLLLKPVNTNELMRTLLHLCERKLGHSLEAPKPAAGAQPSLKQLTSPELLHDEVQRLAEGVLKAVWQKDLKQIRSLAHQLLGMAGLYDMPVLESCTAELHEAARKGDMRTLWNACSRLQRLAQQEHLE
ncbi:ATP-binding protein [Marinobacterium litorale]|uniref:ATP-binding protein n=1 Tax=Marinobacterium litorale TaxID=404770 RepID=UPI000425A516|nr:ATP-binding protein [Marinobacterium litorale]